MIVRGRITVFGEYLMHRHTEGFVVPTRHALATPDERSVPLHPRYEPRLDRVRMRLSELGLPTCAEIRGTLPLGHGLAGSTVLTTLHLGTHAPAPRHAVIDLIDEEMHGFPPSGVDYHAVAAQRAGFFGPVVRSTGRAGPARWRPLPGRGTLDASALLVHDWDGWPLSETRDRIARFTSRLVPIARHLCAALRARRGLDYRALFEYAVLLWRAGVYPPRTAAIVGSLLERKLVAKGVGGLTGKAIIVTWPPNVPSHARQHILSDLYPDEVLPRV